jgi:hypothetical protein
MMIIEPTGSAHFSVDLSLYEVVGYHATSTRASGQIETAGFLPHKILSSDTHGRLLDAAESMGLPPLTIAGYRQWLELRSVTFTKEAAAAIGHARSGLSGGQGLQYPRAILAEAARTGSHSDLVAEVQRVLHEIDAARSVVYAVDLSGLGQRLVQADDSAEYLRIYFHPYEPVPSNSIVGPSRLIARLDV